MTELLPPCLSSFGMIVSWNLEEMNYGDADDSPSLWDLFADYKSSGLNLKHIRVGGEFYPRAPNLTKAFLEIGVQFEVKTWS